ncbi:hypothetical protein QR680_014341 [Steinernema hermaphroditum]|uniref:BetaSPN-type CS-alpha/beta domain-containing protein n=1 Tax=Steinernema hermaphroditum TaxID=289476 RepID=A0AA39IAR0_9BILA|nr:hypothetical protein QR680_014341 [Steinernema hermaphroditum]
MSPKSVLLLCFFGFFVIFTSAHPVDTVVSIRGPIELDYGCPITSSCRKHCQQNKFRDGLCEGTLKLTCQCIG